MDPSSPLYAAWHREHVEGPVRVQQRAQQVAAARRHLSMAQFHRVVGNQAGARRELERAAQERGIAAKMPKM